MASKSWDHCDRKVFGHVYAACGQVRAISDKRAEAVWIDEGPLPERLYGKSCRRAGEVVRVIR